MPHYYGSADIFVSASHREGSGYALIEALACGLVPVVTDIPAFRAIAGPCGERWRVGDAGDLARCLGLVAARDQSRESAEARRWFEANLSWSVIAEQTLSAYAALTPQDREASG
jgi:glycosyltransferase involved in cell wall biosynthesis